MNTWYIIAVIMFPWSINPEFKINTALKFNSFEMCDRYYHTYKEGLEKGLKRNFPQIKEIDLRCVDQNTAYKMQQNMRKRGL